MKKRGERKVLSEEDAERFLKRHVKDRGWTEVEAKKRIRRAAATRWYALEKHGKKVPKKAPKKKEAA